MYLSYAPDRMYCDTRDGGATSDVVSGMGVTQSVGIGRLSFLPPPGKQQSKYTNPEILYGFYIQYRREEGPIAYGQARLNEYGRAPESASLFKTHGGDSE